MSADVGTLTSADEEVVDFLAPRRVVDRSSCAWRLRPVL